MAGRNHLREVNDDWLVVIINHDVEFIKISMDDSAVAQPDYQAHEFFV